MVIGCIAGQYVRMTDVGETIEIAIWYELNIRTILQQWPRKYLQTCLIYLLVPSSSDPQLQSYCILKMACLLN